MKLSSLHGQTVTLSRAVKVPCAGRLGPYSSIRPWLVGRQWVLRPRRLANGVQVPRKAVLHIIIIITTNYYYYY